MKREALLRELGKLARKSKVHFAVFKNRGDGSHYKIEFGEKVTTIQSGELTPLKVDRIKKQLGLK